MKLNKYILSLEQVDYLNEMMNIGTGRAATALSKILNININTIIPHVKVGALDKILPLISPIFKELTQVFAAVRMHMVGDCTGDILFIISLKNLEILTGLAGKSQAGWLSSNAGSSSLNAKPKVPILIPDDMKLSIVCEIGNILAGVYLSALNKFCGLNIVHTVPVTSTDMLQALVDESIALTASTSDQTDSIIVENVFSSIMVENEFTLEKERLLAYLLVIPSTESVIVLAKSIDKAMGICFNGKNE